MYIIKILISSLEKTEKLAKQKIIPGGTKNNFKFLDKNIMFSKELKLFQKLILSDSQTSGGLLISCPKSQSIKLLNELNKKAEYKSIIIGEFITKEQYNITVNNG